MQYTVGAVYQVPTEVFQVVVFLIIFGGVVLKKTNFFRFRTNPSNSMGIKYAGRSEILAAKAHQYNRMGNKAKNSPSYLPVLNDGFVRRKF